MARIVFFKSIDERKGEKKVRRKYFFIYQMRGILFFIKLTHVTIDHTHLLQQKTTIIINEA